MLGTFRRVVSLRAAAVPFVCLALAGTASAALPKPVLNKDALSSAQCTRAGSGAQQVVDVTFRLLNYADSGYADEWAVDTVNRHLRIWKRSDRTYCAQILDEDSEFVTRAGPSPSGNGFVSDGIKGTFEGGYITTNIVGKFVSRYPTHGDLGSFDAKCDAHFNCPGPRPSWLSYFVRPRAEQFVQWGWLYDAGAHGIWLDAADVSPPHNGNITA